VVDTVLPRVKHSRKVLLNPIHHQTLCTACYEEDKNRDPYEFFDYREENYVNYIAWCLLDYAHYYIKRIKFNECRMEFRYWTPPDPLYFLVLQHADIEVTTKKLPISDLSYGPSPYLPLRWELGVHRKRACALQRKHQRSSELGERSR